jgi:hypothetical protein
VFDGKPCAAAAPAAEPAAAEPAAEPAVSTAEPATFADIGAAVDFAETLAAAGQVDQARPTAH